MENDYSDYISALTRFYEAASFWYYASRTNDPTAGEKRSILKERAKCLEKEMAKLPASMARPLVLEHVNKILNASN